MLFVAFLWMRELEKFYFLKLVLAQDSARILPRRSRLRPEASRPGGHLDRQLILGNRFVAIKVVQFHFTGRRQPEIRVLNLEKIGRKLWQLSRADQRSRIDHKWRENLRISVLARVHEIGRAHV